MLRAVFGHNFTDIPNRIPASQGITSAGMLAFFLFWLAHFPLALMRPYQLRTFFNVKTILMIPAVWGLFIFCMANTGASLGTEKLSEASGVSASGKWGWFFMNAVNAGLGNTATLITNQPDIARWSKTRSGAMWSQLITNPIAVTLSASLGILSTAAINNAWGLSLWNQWDLLDAIMDRYWRSDVRFAIFLCAGCWAILASAGVFTTFLAGYGLFITSVVAIMVCEYFLLTRGNLFIAHCYNGGKENPHYYYMKGWNVQAVIAYLCGIALPFPGFVGSLGANVSTTALNMGHIGWLLSFTTSFVLYWAICTVWPTKNQKIIKEMGLRFEEMAERDMMALDGTIIPESAEGMSEDQVAWDETEKKAVAFDSRRVSD
ncbi:unnamed protein product [Aureobasidium pullulans]|nr:unnamed protein product [Aureobasidium pullulans]